MDRLREKVVKGAANRLKSTQNDDIHNAYVHGKKKRSRNKTHQKKDILIFALTSHTNNKFMAFLFWCTNIACVVGYVLLNHCLHMCAFISLFFFSVCRHSFCYSPVSCNHFMCSLSEK